MVKCLPEFECFYFILEKNNSNIRRSKVTDYAALSALIGHMVNPKINHKTTF